MNPWVKTFQFIPPLTLGMLAFFLVIGPLPLNPSNISWIRGLDPPTHYLGWVFFRQSPWGFPLGLNPNYGLEISSSIVYSDSIPLLAIFFKCFSNILPEKFQYLGIWLFCCFIFQAWFSWKLISIISQNILIQLFGAGLFLFMPIMLYRIGVHAALVGQFLILAALYLYFRPTQTKRVTLWTLLLTSTILIHFYLFVMVMALWCADLLDKRFKNKLITGAELTREVIIVLSCVLFVAWLGGYFFSGGPLLTALPYGTGSMNLLAPINSASWSFVLKALPNTLSSYEGFDYVGLGVVLCFIFSLPILVSAKIPIQKIIIQRIFLVILLIGLTLFALSNQVAIGPWKLNYPLPNFIGLIGSVLRQSARFFWPVIYLLTLLFIFIITKYYPRWLASSLLGLACACQIVDTSAGWLPIHHKLNEDSSQASLFAQKSNQLSDIFWTQAASYYDQLLVVPAQEPAGKIPDDWERFASFAAQFHLATNSVYLARLDQKKLAEFNHQFKLMINKGVFNQRAFYILGDEKILPVLMHLDAEKDLLARFNGLNVLAPNWKICTVCPQVDSKYEIKGPIPPTAINKILDFSSNGFAKHYLVGVGAWSKVGWGWSYPETFGVWSEGNQVKLVIPLPRDSKGALESINGITLEMRALISPNHPQQQVDIWVNGHYQKTSILQKNQGNIIDVSISSDQIDSGQDYLEIELKLPNKVKPVELGLGNDIRELGIGLTNGKWY